MVLFTAGLKYLGNAFDAQISKDTITFSLLQKSEEHSLFFTDSVGNEFDFNNPSKLHTIRLLDRGKLDVYNLILLLMTNSF